MKHRNLILLVCVATGCAADDDPIEVRDAALTQEGETAPARDAVVDYDGWLVYNAGREVAAADVWHHLEMIDYRSGSGPALEIGSTYVDGPEVNGRGAVSDWVGDEGILVGDFPIPWIDGLVCDGTTYQDVTHCRQAMRIEVALANADGDATRFTYRFWMEGDVEPSVGGTFTAVKGTWGRTPGD
jgi:hypothetical protein